VANGGKGMDDRPFDEAAKFHQGQSEPGMYDVLDFVRRPIVITEEAMHLVCYANSAFCSLAGRNREELIGNFIVNILPRGDVSVLLLDRQGRTETSKSHVRQEVVAPHPLYWTYDAWPVSAQTAGGDGAARLIIQFSDATAIDSRVTAMNEVLLVSAVRQHELVEAADALNTKLQSEIKRREYAQEALMRSEMLAHAGRMAASIAHEINNPLAAVMNTLFLARTNTHDPKAVRQYLEIADQELLRVAHITRQTLGFYREAAAATNISVSVLIRSVVDVLQAKIRAVGARVEQQCDERLEVIGVFGELRQVLANLLANSLHAVVRDGRIVLRASAFVDPNGGKRRVRITVADGGRGIGAAEMKQIFEPFFTTKGTAGTGIGLWVTRQLVEKNGGSIRVKSNTDGKHKGTAFSIVLPQEPAAPPTGIS
jgi:two-component system, NtrC family, sensor kinase